MVIPLLSRLLIVMNALVDLPIGGLDLTHLTLDFVCQSIIRDGLLDMKSGEGDKLLMSTDSMVLLFVQYGGKMLKLIYALCVAGPWFMYQKAMRAGNGFV